MKQKGKEIKVLIGQVALSREPNTLQTVLGSCIGLAMYDPYTGIAGLAHVLLPKSDPSRKSNLPGKYADDAVECLYKELIKHGAKKSSIKAKVAGGACMFKKGVDSNSLDIGNANIAAIKQLLEKYRVPIVAQDVGGTSGRKVELDLVSFELTVRDFSKRSHVI